MSGAAPTEAAVKHTAEAIAEAKGVAAEAVGKFTTMLKETGALGKLQGHAKDLAFNRTEATLLGAVVVGALAAKMLSGGSKEQGV